MAVLGAAGRAHPSAAIHRDYLRLFLDVRQASANAVFFVRLADVAGRGPVCRGQRFALAVPFPAEAEETIDVYTRVLSLRSHLSGVERYAFLGLYNVAYVVPLALVVVVYGVTSRRLVLGERGAKILKLVSGALLVAFGALFVLAPELLA